MVSARIPRSCALPIPRVGTQPDTPEQGNAEIAHVALENLFEFSPDAIFVTDATGAIRDANPRATELFGYTRTEFAGMHVEDLVPERFRGRHPSHRENYNAHPRARQMGAAMNLFGLRKDGSEFPVDIMLKPMHTINGVVTLSFVRDATEQKEAIEMARRQDLQLRSIVDSVRDYAIYLLDRDGNVMTWNPGAERIKGYTADEIVGKHFSRFFTQEDRDRGRPAELMRMAAQKGRIEEEAWRVRKDGSRFWADIVLTAIRDSSGEVIGFAKVTRDFTDRKRAEEAVMLQLSSALLANMDVRKLLGAISASIGEVIPHDAATLGLYDESTKCHDGAVSGERRQGSARRCAFAHGRLAGGRSVSHPRTGSADQDRGIALCGGRRAPSYRSRHAVGLLGSADSSR